MLLLWSWVSSTHIHYQWTTMVDIPLISMFNSQLMRSYIVTINQLVISRLMSRFIKEQSTSKLVMSSERNLMLRYFTYCLFLALTTCRLPYKIPQTLTFFLDLIQAKHVKQLHSNLRENIEWYYIKLVFQL